MKTTIKNFYAEQTNEKIDAISRWNKFFAFASKAEREDWIAQDADNRRAAPSSPFAKWAVAKTGGAK